LRVFQIAARRVVLRDPDPGRARALADRDDLVEARVALLGRAVELDDERRARVVGKPALTAFSAAWIVRLSIISMAPGTTPPRRCR
jgi:hypothetical protein